MDVIETLNIWTLLLGLASLLFTGYMALFFWQHRDHRLGLAVYINMIAEMIAGGMTVLFSFESIVDWWILTNYQMIVFRNIIFIVLLFSSIHLAWQARKIIIEGKYSNANPNRDN